jgi:hypothetical protein
MKFRGEKCEGKMKKMLKCLALALALLFVNSCLTMVSAERELVERAPIEWGLGTGNIDEMLFADGSCRFSDTLFELASQATTIESLIQQVQRFRRVTDIKVFSDYANYEHDLTVFSGGIQNGTVVRINYDEESWTEFALWDFCDISSMSTMSQTDTQGNQFLFVRPISREDLFTRIPSGGRFGDPRDGGTRSHMGVDFSGWSGTRGTEVIAVRGGTLRRGYQIENGRGRGHYVTIEHTGSNLRTLYQHLREASPVSHNTIVTQGQVIGYVGDSGSPGSDHLHFEVRQGGVDRNPLLFLDPAGDRALVFNPNPNIVANGTYIVRNRFTGLNLDVRNAGTANGTQVQQWNNNNNPAQHWVVTRQSNGTYTLNPAHATNLFLDVDNAGIANGTRIQVRTATGHAAQRFNFQRNAAGFFNITPSHANNTALEVTGNPPAPAGAPVVLWQLQTGWWSQQWEFIRVA